MLKKLSITIAIFVVFGAAAFGVCAGVAPDVVALPSLITRDMPCPVALCSQENGACHLAQDPPAPDGDFVMNCPKTTGCSNTSCHAWSRITKYSYTPSRAHLDTWVVVPVILIICFVLVFRKLR